ncbi:MAG: DUF2207 domain-containing protein [Methanobacterium sp.]|uniref:DUF2207 family protein n=1 Tax=Methanobacterium sp. TaxID=2164 RepID=UPI003D648ECA|nr:DUF2207 domain-containing protein [Methanobacterium sp.]
MNMDIFLPYCLSVGLILLGFFTPLFIYLKYGREPKIDYNAKYEMDLPTDDPPAIVNAVRAGDLRFGFPNSDGFRATILDLIDRKYLFLKNWHSNKVCYSDSILLEINPDYDPDTLWEFEVQVLNFLKEYEEDGIISMDLISESLKHIDNLGPFRYKYEAWREEVKDTLLEGNNFKEAFYSKGDKYLKIFGVLGIITALSLISYAVNFKSFSGTFILCALILWLVSAVSFLLPKKIAGQWTPYGKEYYERWQSFRRYIEDFSLMNEYSPESIKVWNKYLVYATALGAAKEVRKAMWLSLPEN